MGSTNGAGTSYPSSSTPVYSWDRFAQFYLRIIFFLQFTDYDYPFGIFTVFAQ
jgi:hypothetical protein